METNNTVLLVEDNEKLCESNRRALELKGYRVLTALTLGEAREHLKNLDPDVILLDVMLPDGDGMDFCGEIQGQVTSHILFLTAKSEHEDMLRGLNYGGDDYITKPFRLEELLTRVGAAMRRRETMQKALGGVTVGARDLSLNLQSQRAYWLGKDLLLRPKEFSVLKYLMQQRSRYVSTDDLYRELWGMDTVDVRSVKQNIYRIRDKFKEYGVCYSIENKHGHGYRFVEGAGITDS